MRTMLVLALGLVTTPLAADAQWGIAPDGHNQYTFNYSTSMTFGCGPDWAGCAVSGNILTYSSASGSLTFTFTGTSGVFTAGNVSRPLELGTLHVTETGSYSFPTVGHPNTIFLTFNLAVNSTLPIATTAVWRAGYIREGGIVDGSYINPVGNEYGYRDHFTIPTAPRPPRGSTIIVASHGMPPWLFASSADHVLTAQVGLVPEPSTWMMLGTGLLGLGGVALRRRSRAA